MTSMYVRQYAGCCMLTPAQRTAFHASRVQVHPGCQLQDVGVAPAALRNKLFSAEGLRRVGF